MKIRKLLVVALTATLLCGSVNANAYAAEMNTAETVTDVESTEESTNEDTEAEENITTEETEGKETVEEKKEEKKEESSKKEETSKKETKKETTKTKKEVKKETTKETKKVESSKKKAEKEEQKYTKAELRLLSALIFCEAGSEPYAGKLGVGIVVMNRVESKLFPNTMKDVVYQKYQFGPARNGSLNRALASYDNGKFTTANHKDCIKAAKEALTGTKNVTYKGKAVDMKNMLYFSGRVSGAKLTIANHQFK